MKRNVIFVLLCSLLFSMLLFSGCSTNEKAENGLSVVCTSFPPYDLARTLAGDKINVTMLLPAGAEAHSFEPSAQDVLHIRDADLFLYVGGESDVWVEKLLETSDRAINALTLMDCVVNPVYVEEDELDEHIWSSPKNLRKMAEKIAEALCALDAENAAFYRENLVLMQSKITALEAECEKLRGKIVLLGDRNPFAYLANDYGLDLHAAYHGCGHESEPSAAEIAALTEYAAQVHAQTIYYVDFSSDRIAKSVAESVGADTQMLYSCHNVTNDELAEGITIFDLFERDLQILGVSEHGAD